MPRPNRGPYLALNRAGVFEIRHTQHGRHRSLSTRTTDAVVAQRRLAEYILGTRDADQQNGITVSAGWGYYWNEHVRPHCADPARLEFAWKALSPFFGNKLVQHLTSDDFARYTRERLASVSGPTVRRELSALAAACNHLVRTKRLRPGDLPYIPLPAPSRPRDRWLTVEEITVLTQAAQALAGPEPRRLSRLERFLAIALATGARRRAIEKLTWARVDFGRGLIDFNHEGPQTKKRRPVVPIADNLRPVLERAWMERETDCVLDHTGAIRRTFDTAVRKAGLAGVTRHTLRHTWATHASMAGVPLTDVARVLGNSLHMVMRVYAHHQPEYLRSAVNFTPRSYAPGQDSPGNTGVGVGQ